MKKLVFIMFIFLLLLQGCVSRLPEDTVDLLVSSVDIERYAGLWYQVARYPHFFQSDDCAESTAEYVLAEDGKITVLNRCWKDYYGGEYGQQVRARANPMNEEQSWLRVWFYGLFPASYLIIELDENYQWAAVTGPSQDTLWILSRKPFLEKEIYDAIIDSLVEKGFDRDKIIKTSGQTQIN